MKIGQVLTVDINDIGMSGDGIVRLPNYTIFIPDALTGEICEVEVTSIRENIVRAKLNKIILESTDRQKPICPLFGECGGCDVMHMKYAKQLEFKKNALATILRKNAGYTKPIPTPVASSDQLHYRNKLQMPFGQVRNKPILGFYEKKTHNIVSIYNCFLHAGWGSKVLAITRKFAQDTNQTIYNEKTKKGLLKHLVVRYVDGVMIVALVINGDTVENINVFINELKRAFKKVTVYISINKQHNNVVMGDTFIKASKATYPINVSGITLELGPHSFFQVNDNIREKMFNDLVADIMAVAQPTVIDAFGGVGLIGALCAKAGASVYNIEIEPSAIEDANKLAKNNNLTITNICGDIAEKLPQLLKTLLESKRENIKVILDPPRKGLAVSITEALVETSKIQAFEIYYISCNPPTLTRDMSLMSETFEVVYVKPYDMFPQTQHLETLVKLRTRKIGKRSKLRKP
ncbi:MAG: 23S rRNA (uracil(1939)-C(5))-methyltransferase RlmD [Christensenellaceae bacterium]|jgi:23S rRNA (uracil1939-C5)-methyltransferase|nr:23S rRNA (uracil(1939)-C(5))-methyltransferase RlmD [Christensenellaceae bacterium]